MRYDLVKKFLLLPLQSSVSPDAMVIIPNIPFFSGAARMKGEDLLTSWGFQVVLVNYFIFRDITVTVCHGNVREQVVHKEKCEGGAVGI